MNRTLAAAASLCAIAGCASYQKPLSPVAPMRVAEPVVYKFTDKALTARLATILFDLPVGYSYGEFGYGYSGGCSHKKPLINTDGKFNLEAKRYVDLFTTVMKSHGYPVDEDSELFKDTADRVADLQIGARVIEATINECYPRTDLNESKGYGSSSFKIEWSVYSMIEKKVVYRMTSTGSTYGDVETLIGETGILRPAFADALERLARDQNYWKLINRNGPAAPATTVARIHIPRMKAYAGDLGVNLEEIRKAVVTITANKGTGSGFSLTPDMVFTADHVVTGSKYAKIVLAGGKECYGEVVASNKVRDVAVLKVDCPGLVALPLNRVKLAEGSDVFAIGTPLSKDLQFSVTKGVVSGLRKIDDLEYIQSDVKVLPGNSGGPLLDAHGNVVGVTTRGVAMAQVPVGLNFFVPMTDLASYLPLDFD